MTPTAICSDIWFMVPRLPQSQHELLTANNLGMDELEDLLGLRRMEVVNGVAVIPVDGVLANGVSKIDRLYGFVGYEQVREDVEEAVMDESVKGIVLSINSPGGQASGMIETASYIAEASKHKNIIAHTATLAASAAHGLARGATAFYASPSAIVGSVGTYMTVYDVSQMFAAMGVKTHLISSGPFKGAGVPGTEISPEQLAQFQEVVDELAAQFKSFERSRAPQTKEEAMQGQAVTGTQALPLGLVDSVAEFSEAIRDALT